MDFQSLINEVEKLQRFEQIAIFKRLSDILIGQEEDIIDPTLLEELERRKSDSPDAFVSESELKSYIEQNHGVRS